MLYVPGTFGINLTWKFLSSFSLIVKLPSCSAGSTRASTWKSTTVSLDSSPLDSLGQTRKTESKPAWRFSVIFWTVERCTSISLFATKPRLKLLGATVETNFTNDPTGKVGTGVLLRSSNRCTKLFLFRMISELELLWTRLFANSTAWSICLIEDCICLLILFNFSVFESSSFWSVLMASCLHSWILLIISLAAWETPSIAVVILSFSLEIASSTSHISSV